MSKPKKCFYCGEPVVGRTFGCTPICDSNECNEEDRQREIEMQENAEEAAREDGYTRYM